MVEGRYKDRQEAGQTLATHLMQYANRRDVLVLALPRGGVPVAYEVARALHAPLDVFLVRKLGAPGHEELAMGAIASGGIRVLNAGVIGTLGIPENTIEQATEREQRELERRTQEYRDNRPMPVLRGKTVILIDDGLATGATMRAAVRAVRQKQPQRVVVAVPVAAPSTCAELAEEVDEMVCVRRPEPFFGVGLWYENFAQTSDDEVRALLTRATKEIPVPSWNQ
ncbi:putative phosphoribosyltransferase [Thermosporothrix hazakensis]|jgi:predicted phosphoribosyltransferase|uniref:Phosphoribosyl transferase n=2 Tax=Thermosporothrix TaxID=768650 RepID=A0A455SVL5_9CHLR|nr:phosphoribosyltransferase [Thermosporothrix hazakensis]PZW30507.1 putative phosphoribosyltransferase [Thermosporothrix hazakensis]BBH91221.1 phosphoribosyl transferase [Thermosporothrix sp. COM3]GCE49367.1 phosphoribosyl transferase [Thermosporothrix hazakensis]